ncbi:hypothetical protein L247_12770 [Salmonella enterica subsp. enterica serovar Worthington str. BCH-7253]|nr:hypothetical protein L247_12770 [Salmonella enterica subsp. enterica serovar Worthington str. BCH-7253]
MLNMASHTIVASVKIFVMKLAVYLDLRVTVWSSKADSRHAATSAAIAAPGFFLMCSGGFVIRLQ